MQILLSDLAAPETDKIPKVLYNCGRAIYLACDLRCGFDRCIFSSGAAFKILLDQAGIIRDRGERLIDLMGDGRRKLACATEPENMRDRFLV